VNRFIPSIDYEIPNKTDTHLLKVKRCVTTEFDESFPYGRQTFITKLMGFLCRVGLFFIGRIVLGFSVGLRIHGRKIYSKNKKILKKGFISISNHIHLLDNVAHMIALRYKKICYPVWAENLRGPNRHLIKWTGGIPIPEGSIRAMAKFDNAMQSYLSKGSWLHVMAEGSMWDYFSEIRPFKIRSFIWAVNANKPILPMVYTYRPIGRLRHFFNRKSKCSIDLHILNPIFPDLTIGNYNERAVDLLIRTREEIIKNANIEEDIFGFDIYDGNFNPKEVVDKFYRELYENKS
jgi:1-acyl-sn-glycerol-3-phosphate acyltransferase